MTARWIVVTPRHARVSQAWLHAHGRAISSNLVATATYTDPATPWFGDKPNVVIGSRIGRRSYGFGRLARLPGATSATSRLQEHDPTGLIVHFANLFDLVGGRRSVLPDVPTAVYVHGYDITWSPFPVCPIPYKNYANTAAYQRRLVEYADSVVYIANSHHSRKRLIDIGIPSGRVEVCYLPVSVPGEDVPAPVSRSETHNILRLVFIGRFVGFKGPLEVIRAVSIARDRGLSVQLDMIGDGPLHADARKLVEQLGVSDIVRLRGSQPNDEAMGLLAQSDAMILHNQVDPQNGQLEAFGYAHAEALVRGVPVLTARSGGPLEFLVEGENSMMVDPGDVEAQASAIEAFAQDRELRKRLADQAQLSGTRLFSPQAHHQGIEAVLERARAA